MEEGLFKGRTAIVTGGARGIGLACAAKITAGGGRVALWDRDLERTRQSAAALKGAVAIAVDVTSEADVAKALAETEKLLAPPDILVASAGVTAWLCARARRGRRTRSCGRRRGFRARRSAGCRRARAAWPGPRGLATMRAGPRR